MALTTWQIEPFSTILDRCVFTTIIVMQSVRLDSRHFLTIIASLKISFASGKVRFDCSEIFYLSVSPVDEEVLSLFLFLVRVERHVYWLREVFN